MGFWGDLPTWVTTVAVIFAAVQYFAERKRRRSEAEREARAQATQLTAWAATIVALPERQYGIRLSNTSGSTFHDISIATLIHGTTPRHPITLTILPPGEYFVKFNGDDAEFTWDFACGIEELGQVTRPYMKSEKYRVQSVRFRDNTGQQWSTDDRAVLRAAE